MPLDIYVMFDRSGSMNLPQPLPASGNPGAGDCNVGGTTVSRWCYAINALGAFFRAPSSAGIGIALQFFPNGDCNSNVPFGYGCCSSGGCCNGATGLDARGRARNAARQQHGVDRRARRSDPVGRSHADRSGVARTDALHAKITEDRGPRDRRPFDHRRGPEGCESSADRLAAIASSHRSSTGIRTFVMGVEGAVFPTLETIAIAGGAPAHTANCDAGISPCHFYSVRDGTPAAFNNALQAIRRASIACEFSMPTTDAGLIDPDDVLARVLRGRQRRRPAHRQSEQRLGLRLGRVLLRQVTPHPRASLCARALARASRATRAARVDILLGLPGILRSSVPVRLGGSLARDIAPRLECPERA